MILEPECYLYTYVIVYTGHPVMAPLSDCTYVYTYFMRFTVITLLRKRVLSLGLFSSKRIFSN